MTPEPHPTSPGSRALRVAVPAPLPRPFDYLAPDGPAPAADWIGRRVRVPFGRREVVGIVVALVEDADPRTLRRAAALLDDAPLFGAELLATLQWAARYYAHPLGAVLETALPAALRRADRAPARTTTVYAVTPAGVAALAGATLRAGSVARRSLEALLATPLDAAALTGAVPGFPRARAKLLEDDYVAASTADAGFGAARPPRAGPPLDASQREAVDSIVAATGYDAFVLDGVTGSGKTEVYLAAIAAALARGRQCLVLVPEIGLTPQALQRYRERLGVPVAALHSGLGDGDRARAWLAAGRGDVPVVVGTRSAIFTPLARPGLIVVDEEHDASYKQQDGFRYSARDLAVVRARALGVPVVLGSATPSLETLHNAQAGRYRTLRLPERAGGARAPRVHVVDMRRQRLTEGLSAPLLDAVAACTARGEQALVFRNRRGYAPVLLCHACGWHAQCPRCETTLTLHRATGELRCHHCGRAERQPAACPECATSELIAVGVGTERLDEALTARFPGVPVVRIDRDTTRRKDAFAELMAGFDPDGAAILVGTQMLAKGHDLPNLTLAAIVNVDEGLHAADFRGPERLAQLVVQVAGRAGRGAKPGTVLLQTHQPGHPLFAELLEGGYAAFARRALAEREALGFPPFAHFAVLRAEAKQPPAVQAFLDAARAALAAPDGVAVDGPLPAPMPLRGGFRRGQLVVHAAERRALHAVLGDWVEGLYALPEARKVRWSIDVDPVDLY